MTSPAAGKRRMDQDVIRLIESNHEVEIMDSLKHFMVKFNGPKNTPYEGGMWKIRVMLPDDYPFKSPSIGFINRIFHPNIDEASGSVCLDVINQTWTPVFDLVNIFESFLPQLLTYPNAADPLNGEAASMLMSRPSEYERRIKDGVKKYATQEAFEKIRDKGMILSYPPNRMQRGGSTSSASGFNGNNSSIGGANNIAGGGGGATHALTSASMPPAVSGFGRGAFATPFPPAAAATSSAAAQQQPTATSSTNDSRSSGNSNSSLSNGAATNGAAAAATNGHLNGAASNGQEHNGASSSSSNGTSSRNGASATTTTTHNSADDDLINDDMEADDGHDEHRRKKQRNRTNDAEANDDIFDGGDDDAGDASDLSEFSENEADQMEL